MLETKRAMTSKSVTALMSPRHLFDQVIMSTAYSRVCKCCLLLPVWAFPPLHTSAELSLRKSLLACCKHQVFAEILSLLMCKAAFCYMQPLVLCPCYSLSACQQHIAAPLNVASCSLCGSFLCCIHLLWFAKESVSVLQASGAP